MNASPIEADRFASPEPRLRELTPSETDHVSGGIVPIILVGAAIAAAVVQQSGDDSEDAPQDDD